MKNHTITILPNSPIYFGNLFSDFDAILRTACDAKKVVIISDENVAPHYAQPLQTHLKNLSLEASIITIPAGEQSKTQAMKTHIETQLFSLGCTRDTILLALGGGVITDLVGFVAATYCRGIPVIYIPTTLLCMVDAAIGGKTGINTDYGKNLIGTFTYPVASLIDMNMLDTLPDAEYISGFAEIIKHALISDAAHFNYLAKASEKLIARDKISLQHVIPHSAHIKAQVVASDNTDKNKRAILNFGHTIGHALEMLSDYTLPHGQAVSIGMVVESKLAMQQGLLTSDEVELIKSTLERFGLPTQHPDTVKQNELKEALYLDKKTKQNIPHFVLLKSIGEVHTVDSQYTHPIEIPIVL